MAWNGLPQYTGPKAPAQYIAWLEAEVARLQLDAHTKDAFYGAEIAEKDAEIARLQKGVDELTAESNRYFKALLEIQNLSGRAVIPEEQALQESSE